MFLWCCENPIPGWTLTLWGHLITRYNKREDSFSETHPTTAIGFVDLKAAKMCLNHADVTNSLPTRLQTKSSLNQLVVVWLYGIMKFFSHKIVLEYFKKTICQMTKIEELIISSYRTTQNYASSCKLEKLFWTKVKYSWFKKTGFTASVSLKSKWEVLVWDSN